jgi:hypothetical protein
MAAAAMQRQWSAILDGHTVFKLGVELHASSKVKVQQPSALAEIDECTALHDVPGSVGDMEARSAVGKIRLVNAADVAVESSLYQ